MKWLVIVWGCDRSTPLGGRVCGRGRCARRRRGWKNRHRRSTTGRRPLCPCTSLDVSRLPRTLVRWWRCWCSSLYRGPPSRVELPRWTVQGAVATTSHQPPHTSASLSSQIKQNSRIYLITRVPFWPSCAVKRTKSRREVQKNFLTVINCVGVYCKVVVCAVYVSGIMLEKKS